MDSQSLIDVAHVHLLLNHFPTVGLIIGVGLFLLSLTRHNDDLRRASLAVFFGLALISLPAYMSGYAAQDAVDTRAGIDMEGVHRHQAAALLALVFIELTGVLAWIELWRSRRSAGPSAINSAAVLLLSVVTLVLMASAATAGGEILHEHIRVEGAPSGTLAPTWLRSQAVTDFFTVYRFAWPVLEGLHFIGLALLIGVVLTAYLRVAGIVTQVSAGAVHRLLPWGLGAFVLQTATGMAFYIAQAFQYVYNPSFQWKMAGILVAGGGLLYLTYHDDEWDGIEARAPSRTVRVLFALQVLVWMAVIYFGRMLPYLGQAY